tara:strand:+ start:204 stop:1061 length:858 start_codon:yes stop_codon:yes gene_type:complete
MKIGLKQIKKFNEDGYIIYKNLLSKKEIRKIFFQLDLLLNTILIHNNIKFKKGFSIEKKYFLLKKKKKTLKSKFYDCIRILDSFNTAIYSEKIVKIIKKLLNTKTLLITNHRLRTDHKNEKANLSLHQELNNISTESALIFCPLVKVNKNTGSLCIIPKSHKFGHLQFENSKIPAEEYNNGKIDKILKGTEISNYKNSRVRELFRKENLLFPNLNPGDAVIFRSMLFHGSTNYKGPGIRWTMLGNYHLPHKTPYLLDEKFKSGGYELGIPMRIPYNKNLNKIFRK